MIHFEISKLASLLSEFARKGAKIKRHGRMCKTCAFRRGSITQKEVHNIAAAAECLAWYGTFNCHKDDQAGVDAGTPCVGFLNAKEYRDKLESK